MRRIARTGAAWASILLLAACTSAPEPIDLPGERAFSESITIAPDGTAYVGSLSGGVWRVALDSGRVEPWIKPGGYGTGSTFGVLADPVNHLLWVCSNDLSFAGVAIAGADKGSTLKGFDLKTGAGKVSLQLPGEQAFCNDMAVARDGTLYVTNTTPSHILRWRKGTPALEMWSADPAFATAQGGGLDGIAIGEDGNLYVNNFQSHIFARVAVNPDGSAGKVTLLHTSRPLDTPDGLRAIGGMRFVQAEASGKVALLTVAGDDVAVKTLAQAQAPTGVAAHDGTLWYVRGEPGYIFNPTLRDKKPPLPFRVIPVALPKP
ncbi:MAG TPA: hypothetical protein VNS79_04875 [Sphingobium sp.]|nr:hypothetical protein [Sphingobium sp.]